MKFNVRVPATSANIGPGYDVWGVALNIYNEFIVTVSEKSESHKIEPHLGDLAKVTADGKVEDLINSLKPANMNENLFFQSYETLFEKRGIAAADAPRLSVEAHINIPLARGLGSSSTAVLGGLIAANEVLRKFYAKAFSIADLFEEAVAIEGHPDNAAPALWGGFMAGFYDRDEKRHRALSLPWKAPVALGGVVPHISLATSKARSVVPSSVAIEDCAWQASRTAILTHIMRLASWSQNEKDLLKIALDERLHQEARAALIPGMSDAMKDWKNKGALGVYLSGAGTTLLGMWSLDDNIRNKKLGAPFEANGVKATEIYPALDTKGLIVDYL